LFPLKRSGQTNLSCVICLQNRVCTGVKSFVFLRASVAQLAEQLTLNQRAGSSSLPGRTKSAPAPVFPVENSSLIFPAPHKNRFGPAMFAASGSGIARRTRFGDLTETRPIDPPGFNSPGDIKSFNRTSPLLR
jgi:hypothetical protein